MHFDWAKGDVIVVDGAEVGRADRAWFRERAEVQIGPAQWLYRTEGSWGRRPVVAELEGIEQFRATPSGFFSTTWTVDAGVNQLQLRQASMFSSRLVVSRAGGDIGEATRSGFFTSRTRLQLTEPLEPAVGCFLLWVAFIEFHRRQAGAGAGAT